MAPASGRAYVDTAVTGGELVTGELGDAGRIRRAAAWLTVAASLFFIFIGWLIAVLVSALLQGLLTSRRAAATSAATP
jgi:hypothetical protein